MHRRQFVVLSHAAAITFAVGIHTSEAGAKSKPIAVVDLSDSGALRVGFAGQPTPTAVYAKTARSPETLLRNAFKKLGVAPSSQRLLLVVGPSTSVEEKARLQKLALTTLKVPALAFVDAAVAAVHASGHDTGLALVVGESGTFAQPVVKGLAMSSGLRTTTVGGASVTTFLEKLLGSKVKTLAAARDVKEKLAYVAMDYEEELAKVSKGAEGSDGSGATVQMRLRDGEVITVGAERFRCPEVLFSPPLIGSSSPSVTTVTRKALSAVPEKARPGVYGHVVVSGGTSLLPGLTERIQKAFGALTTPHVFVRSTMAGPHATYQGGAILAGFPSLEEIFTTSPTQVPKAKQLPTIKR